MGISKNPGRTKHGREGGVPPDPSIDIHAYTHTNRLNALLPDHSHTHCYMYIFRWSMAAVCKLLGLYIGVLVLNIQIHHKHPTYHNKPKGIQQRCILPAHTLHFELPIPSHIWGQVTQAVTNTNNPRIISGTIMHNWSKTTCKPGKERKNSKTLLSSTAVPWNSTNSSHSTSLISNAMRSHSFR